MSKKNDTKKKKSKKCKSDIFINDDTIYMSLVRGNVLTAILNRADIDSLIMYNKKGKEKLLEGLKEKFVFFKLHSSYELRDKNGVKVEPVSENKDNGFNTYKIKMKSFLNTVKANLIEKDFVARKYYDEKEDKFVGPEIKAYHAVSTTSKAKESEKLYLWNVVQIVGEVRNKKKKKVCDIRFDL